MEITRNSILQAIEKIDSNPKLRENRSSSTYDLVFNKIKYPPILVLSVANQLYGNKELFLSDFNNKVDVPFKILRDNGFEIQKKDMNYHEELHKFLEQAKTDNLKTSHYLKTLSNLKVKVSFGQGVPANIPWISFLRDGMTTSEGIYPGYLFFKNQSLLILSYGISETNEVKYDWQIDSPKTINSYFVEKKLEKPFRYGKSFVCQVYDVNQLPTADVLDSDLINLIEYYKSLNFDVKSKNKVATVDFNLKNFHQDSSEAGLFFSASLITRFIASLTAKPFLILSGLSGSGKTKIAQSFVQWLCENKTQYKIVPVGADWTNREPLVGYPNGLDA